MFSRNRTQQLGYLKQTAQIEVEGQIKLLYELWDADKSGTVEVDELSRGLVLIGLGASSEFTKMVGREW